MADFRPLLQRKIRAVAKMQQIQYFCLFSVIKVAGAPGGWRAFCATRLMKVKGVRGDRSMIRDEQ
jgi:hypothetical protein